MNSESSQSLLSANDPAPVQITNPGGPSPFLLIGDHAGNLIPESLGTLGLDEVDRTRHIAWDIGIAGLGMLLAEQLDAPFIRQAYSRLVIDCNRDPAAHDAMPEMSDRSLIPGNAGLAPEARAARVAAIQAPYQSAIAAELERRDAVGQQTIMVALHSFTPSINGKDRPWQIGLLYHAGDPSFARAMLAMLCARGDLTVGDNEPYAMDSIDYTIPQHAYPRRRPYVEIEIRQDLLATAAQQAQWAALLKDVLVATAAL